MTITSPEERVTLEFKVAGPATTAIVQNPNAGANNSLGLTAAVAVMTAAACVGLL